MSLIVAVLVVALASRCWTTPQRRNWTPQAMLYLRGAAGHRSVLERSSRGGGAALHSASRGRGGDGRRSSAASSALLELLLRAVAEAAADRHPDEEELDLNYL